MVLVEIIEGASILGGVISSMVYRKNESYMHSDLKRKGSHRNYSPIEFGKLIDKQRQHDSKPISPRYFS